MSMSADGDFHSELVCRGRGELWILRFHFQIHKQEKIMSGGECERYVGCSKCAHIDLICAF